MRKYILIIAGEPVMTDSHNVRAWTSITRLLADTADERAGHNYSIFQVGGIRNEA